VDLERQIRRNQARAKYDKEMAELDHELRNEREQVVDLITAAERERSLQQKRRDLEVAKENAQSTQLHSKSGSHAASGPMATIKVASAKSSKGESPKSIWGRQISPLSNSVLEGSAKTPSEMEWARQKRVDNASNDAIETLMGLTGLEGVKAKVLSIKAKIETVSRQGGNLKKERLGIVMLGNPGTGERCNLVEMLKGLTAIQARQLSLDSMRNFWLRLMHCPEKNLLKRVDPALQMKELQAQRRKWSKLPTLVEVHSSLTRHISLLLAIIMEAKLF
jgi:hypothetical protein